MRLPIAESSPARSQQSRWVRSPLLSESYQMLQGVNTVLVESLGRRVVKRESRGRYRPSGLRFVPGNKSRKGRVIDDIILAAYQSFDWSPAMIGRVRTARAAADDLYKDVIRLADQRIKQEARRGLEITREDVLERWMRVLMRARRSSRTLINSLVDKLRAQ